MKRSNATLITRLYSFSRMVTTDTFPTTQFRLLRLAIRSIWNGFFIDMPGKIRILSRSKSFKRVNQILLMPFLCNNICNGFSIMDKEAFKLCR